MDLFLINCHLYVIYGQITFCAVNFDWNKILTCSFSCWTLWIQGYHPDCIELVNYGYSWNVGNMKNFKTRMTRNDQNSHSHTTHTYQLVVTHPLNLLQNVIGAGHVLTCGDVVPIGHVPQVSTPVQVSTQPTTGHVRA